MNYLFQHNVLLSELKLGMTPVPFSQLPVGEYDIETTWYEVERRPNIKERFKDFCAHAIQTGKIVKTKTWKLKINA